MVRVFIFILLSISLYAIDFSMLTREKQELLEQKKIAIESGYKRLKYDYVGDVMLNGSIGESRSANMDNNRYSSGASIGFKQDLFKSGGIESSIDYATYWYKSALLELEMEKNSYLLELATARIGYEIELLKQKQNSYKLKNSEIVLLIKEHQFRAGEADITALNDAIRERNLAQRALLLSKNSLMQKELDIKRVSSKELVDITLESYENIGLDNYLQKNLAIELAKYKSKIDQTQYELTKSSYLPTLSFSANYGYQKNEGFRGDDYYNYALNLSMPLSFKEKYAIDEKKAQSLRSSIAINDEKIEAIATYNKSDSSIKTIEESISILRENIKLYDKLISITKPSVNAGERTKYDLVILENTKEIDMLEIEQNSLSIDLERAKMFYAIKGDK